MIMIMALLKGTSRIPKLVGRTRRSVIWEMKSGAGSGMRQVSLKVMILLKSHIKHDFFNALVVLTIKRKFKITQQFISVSIQSIWRIKTCLQPK